VVLLDSDREKVRSAEREGYDARRGDGTEIATLREVGAGHADVVVTATSDDDTNLLVCQLVRSQCEADRVVALVNRSENVRAFEELGLLVVSKTDATALMIDNYIERPALTRWTERVGHGGDVQEVEVTNAECVGRSVRELDALLPDQCLIVLHGSDEGTALPDPELTLEAGDHLVVIGARDAVAEAVELLDPPKYADE
jgi:Trk K+ transport system NAD-binding subunit